MTFAPEEAELKLQEATRINRRKDLSQERSLARFTWEEGAGDERSADFSKRDRQVLDRLIIGPMFCASPVRVGDSVLRIRRAGVPVETLTFSERDGDEALTFGVYVVDPTVQREGA